MDILLTNDDGVLAEGLSALREALEPLGRGLGRRSRAGAERARATPSRSHRPLRVRQLGERVFTVDGTPTDCVLLAVRGCPT